MLIYLSLGILRHIHILFIDVQNFHQVVRPPCLLVHMLSFTSSKTSTSLVYVDDLIYITTHSMIPTTQLKEYLGSKALRMINKSIIRALSFSNHDTRIFTWV